MPQKRKKKENVEAGSLLLDVVGSSSIIPIIRKMRSGSAMVTIYIFIRQLTT